MSAGEASGDAYAAALLAEIQNLGSFSFEGVGGEKFSRAGATIHADSRHWGAISIVQSLKVYPRILRGYYRAKAQFKRGKPGLFIPIDFGYVNIRLARYAKRLGWKVLYFVPPGSWRRDRQGKDLPLITDAIVTPFSWSAEMLNAGGGNAFWFGHPIKQILRDRLLVSVARGSSVAVLPGSRQHEIDENLPVIAKALPADRIAEFALAPGVDVAEFKKRWSNLAPDRKDIFTVGDTVGPLRRAEFGLICSGTATLEAALCDCPMVVMYRVSRSMALEAKLIGFKIPKFISLPNILLNRKLVPEFVHDAATPDAVFSALTTLDLATQRLGFAELSQMLGPEDAISATAGLAVQLLKEANSEPSPFLKGEARVRV